MRMFYIGGCSSVVAGERVFSMNNVTLNYTNWQSNEPSSSSSGECVAFDDKGLWRAVPRHVVYSSVCEIRGT